MTMTKAEKAELDRLGREVRRLEEANETLRGTIKIDGAVGHITLDGYHDEPLPLGNYFRLSIADGSQSDGLEVCLSDGALTIRCSEGVVMALSGVSNVMRFIRGFSVPDGVALTRARKQ